MSVTDWDPRETTCLRYSIKYIVVYTVGIYKDLGVVRSVLVQNLRT